MPYCEQWASCFIKRYCNYGQRVYSPVETAYKNIKSYLLSGMSDLFHPYTVMVSMIDYKERDYI